MTVSFSPPLWKLKFFHRLMSISFLMCLHYSKSFSFFDALALSVSSSHLPPLGLLLSLSRILLPFPGASSTGGWNLQSLRLLLSSFHAWPVGSATPCVSVPIFSHSSLCPGTFHNCFLLCFSFFHALDFTFCRWDRPAYHCRAHPAILS